MREFETFIHNPTGLHARPAKVFVNIAKQFSSDIRVFHGKKVANAKSLISMLTLGAERGAQVRITAAGTDEDEAVRALEESIRDGLGEEMAATSEPTAREGNNQAQQGAQTSNASSDTEPEPAGLGVKGNKAENGVVVTGIAAAPGIAIGPVFHLRTREITVDDAVFAGEQAEQSRLQQALEAAHAELVSVREQLAQHAAAEATIFETHAEILDDPDLLEQVQAQIAQKQNAARAWQIAITRRAAQVAALDDALLAERAADLRDVGRRVLRLLMGKRDGPVVPQVPAIIVAHDLSPSDTVTLSRRDVLGFCTAAGGPTAHAAILARALRLPAVVGAGSGVLNLENNTTVVLDGHAGTLTIAPDEAMLAAARAKQTRRQKKQDAATAVAAEPAITRDGHRVEVMANIGGVTDAREAASVGAEGIGLLRTEFLFLDRKTPPGEDEQAQVYGEIVRALGGHPVVVRTLDIGGDKPVSYIDVPHEANPFLGERGIRLCLARPELMRLQVRAILQAAKSGPVRIMFPMVADIREWRQARELVETERAAMEAPQVELGIMIEVPSAALLADRFAAEVDFFSIGTNDLTQYTLAMDRMHPTLAAQSDGLHPAVLSLIAQTVDAAHAHGKWVGVCGELGADPDAVPILVGLGVDELSVNVPAVASLKAQIRALTLADAQALAEQALGCDLADEVRALVAARKEPTAREER